MANRISALAGHYHIGKSGLLNNDQAGVTLKELPDLTLHQIAAWPNTLKDVGGLAAKAAGCKTAPTPGKSATGSTATLLRIEPLKWWILGEAALNIDAEKGTTLDLSHSRTRIQVSGENAVAFLNRHLPLDLREASFPSGAVGSTAIHHVGITLWRTEQAYELFIPRGFALSLWEGFTASAAQFGLEVV